MDCHSRGELDKAVAQFMQAARVLALLLGEGAAPRSAAECGFVVATITLGVFGLSVVIGQVTLAAQDLNAIGRKKTEQVDAVLLYLRYRGVPADVRREIVHKHTEACTPAAHAARRAPRGAGGGAAQHHGDAAL